MISNSEFLEILPSLHEACIKAGELQKKYHKTDIDIATKSNKTPVTKIDIDSNIIISDSLKKITPEIPIISEEDYEGQDKHDSFWIVDPLDGTSNFLHGIPHWAISIALEHKKEVVIGVIYDPIKNECYVAEKGNGAWLNEKRLRVSGRENMLEMLFATGIPFANKAGLSSTLQEINHLMPKCSGLRRNGAAALDLAYVAAGRYDGYFQNNLNLWDIAAGIIIVKEAGGIINEIDLSSLKNIKVLASSAEINTKYIEKIGNF